MTPNVVACAECGKTRADCRCQVGFRDHICKLEPFCDGSPDCEWARCDGCGAPNGRCVCP